MMFMASVALAQSVAADLRSRGRTAEAVWGAMPDADRAAAIERYASGETQTLANANLLTEGVDIPRTACVVLARGFMTPGPYLQAIARAMRPAPGKTRALVVDLRGVSHLHGAPDAERTWSLEGRACRRPGDSSDVRFCPVCGAVVAASECEECGHAGEMRKRAPKILGLPMQRFAVLRQEGDDRRVLRLSRWLSTARTRGWREGQAFHRFKGAYGAWPSHDIIRRAKEIA
jgi:superfamily II DNA or RNA helicase